MRWKSFAAGRALGIVAGVGGTSVLAVNDFTIPRTYVVRNIKSHYPQENADSETEVVVYQKGNSGHVTLFLCRFPPNLTLQQDSAGQWSGLDRVRVGGVATRYAFGGVAYRCDPKPGRIPHAMSYLKVVIPRTLALATHVPL